MAEANPLTADYVRQHLSYDPETGVFRWLIGGKGRNGAGEIAGGLNTIGYWTIGLLGKRHYAHRLAWLLSTGQWPAEQIDHINGDRSDNRLSNLRLATHAENQQNRHRTRANKTGHRGVFFHNPTGRYVAQCRVLKVRHHIGSFDTAAEAHAAYLEARARLNPYAAT